MNRWAMVHHRIQLHCWIQHVVVDHGRKAIKATVLLDRHLGTRSPQLEEPQIQELDMCYFSHTSHRHWRSTRRDGDEVRRPNYRGKSLTRQQTLQTDLLLGRQGLAGGPSWLQSSSTIYQKLNAPGSSSHSSSGSATMASKEWSLLKPDQPTEPPLDLSQQIGGGIHEGWSNRCMSGRKPIVCIIVVAWIIRQELYPFGWSRIQR